MQILLEKYYDYFLKGNFQDKNNIDDNSEFNNFYKIIINLQDITNNKNLINDLNVFTNFFESGPYKIRPFFNETRINEIKEKFEENENVSFNWFIPSPYLKSDYYSKDFIYSYPSTRECWAKVYIPIKPNYYIKTIIKLQEFINFLADKYDIYETGQCKFRKKEIANDSIVMRFSCKEHYEEFLNFLNNNKEIYEGFDTPNQFLPIDNHGLSIITDCGGSYNYFATRMIWDYMFECREKKENVNIQKLIDFIINYDTKKDKIMRYDDQNVIEDFKYVLVSKLQNINDKEIIETLFNENKKIHTLKKRG